MKTSTKETKPLPTIASGRYELRSRIGAGGMGEVYLGRQVDLDRPVAIKVLRSNLEDQPGLISRFKQEAKAAKSLTHPNTVRIYDFGESEDGKLFLVLEFLDGMSLDRLIDERGKLPLDLVKRIGVQVLKSLIEAHHYGVVHRDMKPSNLMLCHQPGEPDHVKVLDFGIARLADGAAHKTATGAIVGTPHYMAPEQAMAEPVSPRTDLYSLGITLIELATGELPYPGRSPFKIAMRHASPDPVPIVDWLRESPLGAVLAKAVEKKPADRYASAEEMLEAMTRLGAPSPALSSVDPAYRATQADEGLRPTGEVVPPETGETVPADRPVQPPPNAPVGAESIIARPATSWARRLLPIGFLLAAVMMTAAVIAVTAGGSQVQPFSRGTTAPATDETAAAQATPLSTSTDTSTSTSTDTNTNTDTNTGMNTGTITHALPHVHDLVDRAVAAAGRTADIRAAAERRRRRQERDQRAREREARAEPTPREPTPTAAPPDRQPEPPETATEPPADEPPADGRRGTPIIP